MIRTLALCLFATAAAADGVVATRMIRPHEVLASEDLRPVNDEGMEVLAMLIGQEARVALYPGRAVRRTDVGPPALIERNQLVPLMFDTGMIQIQTEGRSLGRGGVGDVIRVMNLSSRTTVSARIAEDGTARVAVGGFR